MDRQRTRGGARRYAARAGAVALLGLLAAGCGGRSGSPVASLSGSHAATGSQAGGLTTAQSDTDMVDFARCMRAHGVQMSDPFHRPGHSGLSIDIPTQDAATRPAFQACNRLIQPIAQAKGAGGAPAPAALLAALTRYAQCMRARDIPMLDPTSFGAVNLGDVPGITSDFGRYSPQFRSADAGCRHLLPAAVHDDGTGP